MESGKKIVIGEAQKEPFMKMLEKDVTVSVYSSHVFIRVHVHLALCRHSPQYQLPLRYICLFCLLYIHISRLFAILTLGSAVPA